MFLHVSVCPQGGVVSQHALQVSGGCIPACLAGFQTHTQGGAWGIWPGGSPDLHLGGLQATPRGSPGPHPGGSPGPHLGRSPGPHLGGVSRPTPGGCLQAHTRGVYASMHWGRPPPRLMASAAGGVHPTGMHSCLNIYLSISHINISFTLFMIPRKIPRNLLCESGCWHVTLRIFLYCLWRH